MECRDLGDGRHQLNGADLVINLTGRSVNCRDHRRELLESRVRSTRVIGQAIQESAEPPTVWMNASTATIYRHAMDRPMDEFTGELGGSEPGVPASWRFSIHVAREWERTFFTAVTPHTRRVALRSAMVMSPASGGVFSTLLGLVRAGLGGKGRVRRAIRFMDSRCGLRARHRTSWPRIAKSQAW